MCINLCGPNTETWKQDVLTQSIFFSLEVVLVKQAQEHHWSSVIKGDDRGMYELVGEEAERVKEIHSRLEHLTSDKIVSDTMP